MRCTSCTVARSVLNTFIVNNINVRLSILGWINFGFGDARSCAGHLEVISGSTFGLASEGRQTSKTTSRVFVPFTPAREPATEIVGINLLGTSSAQIRCSRQSCIRCPVGGLYALLSFLPFHPVVILMNVLRLPLVRLLPPIVALLYHRLESLHLTHCILAVENPSQDVVPTLEVYILDRVLIPVSGTNRP